MKNFSKKSRIRMLTLLISGVCVSTGVNIAMLGQKAEAETSYAKPEVMKIETLVDKHADLVAVNSAQGGFSVMNNWWKVNQEKSYETATTSDHYYLGIFDKKGYNENNPVEYDGDVGIWYDREATNNNTSSAAKIVGIGYKLQSTAAKANGGYGVISFRTKWTTGMGDISLGMMVEPTSPYARWQNNGNKGYWIGLTGTDVNILGYENTTAEYFEKAVAYANTPTDGDELIITYGIWESSVTARSIYLQVENKTQDEIAYETLVVDEDITNNTVYKNGSGALAGTFSIAKTASTYEGMENDPVLLVAGIDEPLFTNYYSLTDTSYSVYEGDPLPALKEDRYAWAEAEETAVVDKTEYNATYSFDYYGKTISVPVTVAVQVINAAYKTMPKVMKIETLVDKHADLVAVNSAQGGFSVMNSSWKVNQEKSYVTATDSAKYHLGIFDKKGYNENNPVEYDGDVGIWYDIKATNDDTSSSAKIVGIGYKLQSTAAKAKGGYGVISFRTKWTTGTGDISLGMMVETTSPYARWQDNGKKGYWIGLTGTDVNILGYENTTAEYFEKAVAYANTPTDGDELIITYGIWESSATARAIYLKVENKTQDKIAYETLVVDKDITNNTVYKNGSGALAGTFSIAKTASTYEGMEKDPVLLVAGIDEPLFKPSYSLTDTSYSVNEGEPLPALTEDGYVWKNENEVAVYDTTEYDAIYSYNYYGTPISVPVTVAVQVKALPRVTLKLMNGETELYSESLLKGEEVAFGDLSLENVDTIIGWKLNATDKLVSPNTVYTALEDDLDTIIVYNVVDMDMKQYKGASIRTMEDGNGYGGLRFVAMFNTEDWEANAAYIKNAYGVIVPADDATYYTAENGFTAAAYALGAENESFKGKDPHSNATFKLENAEEYSLYSITMTNVKYANYNREFVSMTYITVQYEDETELTFETNTVKRSVYEVALAAKAHQQANGNKIYNKTQMEVIDGYIANVIDVSYDGEAFKIEDREDHALVRPYALDSASIAEKTVTLVFTSVAADSLLAEENGFAPVWYTSNNVTKRYKGTIVSYTGGTATVTFTID